MIETINKSYFESKLLSLLCSSLVVVIEFIQNLNKLKLGDAL